MRTVTYGAACSLDGFIARADGGVDWLKWSSDAGAIMSAYWKTIDTVVMGRKTYEVSTGGKPASKSKGYPGVQGYVFSRSSKKAVPKGIEWVQGDAAEFVARLKQEPGKGICVLGGGELAHALLEAGVIDEVGLNVHPIVLGSGIPFFLPAKRSIELELLESRPIAHGCVYLRYRVMPPKLPPKRK